MNCVCKKISCPRHGDCKTCRVHHAGSKRGVYCERKRKNAWLYGTLYGIAGALAVGCIVAICVDARKYAEVFLFYSAPFEAYVIVRLVEFLPMAIVCLVAGLILHKRSKRA